jgi:hypothetical protein
MREGTTSRAMAADRIYGEFCDFYSVSPEYFGNHHVHVQSHVRCRSNLSINESSPDSQLNISDVLSVG